MSKVEEDENLCNTQNIYFHLKAFSHRIALHSYTSPEVVSITVLILQRCSIYLLMNVYEDFVKVSMNGTLYHKSCFKCTHRGFTISPSK